MFHVFAGIVLTLVLSNVSHALVFNVNTTLDTLDAHAGDGVCADAAGRCSLRAALLESALEFSPDTINLPAGTYTHTLTSGNEIDSGDWNIISTVTINGAGNNNTILRSSAGTSSSSDRVINVSNSGAIATINNIKIMNGRTAGSVSSDTEGGGIRNVGTLTLNNVIVALNESPMGGGIFSRGSLTLINSDVINNRCVAAPLGVSTGACVGGGITAILEDGKKLKLINSRVLSNAAVSSGSITSGAGIHFQGTGKYSFDLTDSTVADNIGGRNSGSLGAGLTLNIGPETTTATVKIAGSLIEGNHFGFNTGEYEGAGLNIRNFGTGVVNCSIERSRIENNRNTNTIGGGMLVEARSGVTSVIMQNSSVTHNRARSGGGIALRTMPPGSGQLTLQMINSTVSMNEAFDNTQFPDAEGGGIFVQPHESGGRLALSINFSTIARNIAYTQGGGISNLASASSVIIRNSIVADNTGLLNAPDVAGAITSANYNHFSILPFGITGVTTNDTFGPPMLGPLQTVAVSYFHIPNSGSPVINAIPNGMNGCGGSPLIDQRFFARPASGACDKGSVEQ